MFLASPEPTGPSSTTYVYRTPSRAAAATGTGEGAVPTHTLGWIVLGLLLAAGVPPAAVIWAHS